MPATKIMLIRHAEKPNGDGGIMPDGAQNPEALTATGWTRANALVGLFAPGEWDCPAAAARQADEPVRLGIGKPAAEADDRAAGRGAQSPDRDVARRARRPNSSPRSRRPRVRLSSPGSTRRSPRSRALIRGRADGVPPVWPGHRFDLVWVFDLNADGSVELRAGAAAPAAGQLGRADRLGRLASSAGRRRIPAGWGDRAQTRVADAVALSSQTPPGRGAQPGRLCAALSTAIAPEPEGSAARARADQCGSRGGSGKLMRLCTRS